jgi:hypothetical protein
MLTRHAFAPAAAAVTAGLLGLSALGQTGRPADKGGDDLRPPLRKPVVGTVADGKLVARGPNLVPNGDFEEGDVTPRHWQTVDGLCSFYVKDDDPAHGKVIKFDTDVRQDQAYDWWFQIFKGASPRDAPQKLPTVEPKYDTIAGNDGVWFWSDYFPVEKGKAYWLTVDVKGPGILVWLVGYKEKGGTAFGSENGAFQDVIKEKSTGKPVDKGRGHEPYIHSYVWKGQMAAGGADTWKTYSRRERPFRPTLSAGRANGVKWARVLIFPFWPPGVYYVDNVRVVEVEDAKGAEPAAGGKTDEEE